MAGFRGNYKDFNLKNNKDRDRVYNMFTDEQKILFHSIKDNVFTFCESVSGSGKTLTSVAALLDLLANEEINKIYYIQKVSRRYLQNGYLPGTIYDKTEDLWDPFYGAMITLGFTPEQVDVMISNELVVLTTDSTLRGINIEKSGVCVDEAENCDIETLRLVFTRCHDDCHIVLIGDRRQKDNPEYNTNFIKYGEYLAGPSFGNKCILTKNFRGKFSAYAENFSL